MQRPTHEAIYAALASLGPWQLGLDRMVVGIEAWISELLLWNPKLGLIESDGSDLLDRHILDCLLAVPSLSKRLARDNNEDLVQDQAKKLGHRTTRLRAADIGSGSGLPGLMLALAFPDIEWTLVEKQGRRCSFLLNAAAKMGLTNVVVEQRSLADLPSDSFDLVTARAFRPLEPGILTELSGVLVPSGLMMLYKGRRERIAEELASLTTELAVNFEIEALVASEGLGERHLVWYRRAR